MACPVASPCFSAKWIPPAVTGETIPAASPTSSTRRAAAGSAGALARSGTAGGIRGARKSRCPPQPRSGLFGSPRQPAHQAPRVRRQKVVSGGGEVDRGHVGCVQADPVHAPCHLGRQAVEE